MQTLLPSDGNGGKMMENLFYTPLDLAWIFLDEDLTVGEEHEVLNQFWQNERIFIAPEYRENKKLFFKQIDTWKFFLTYCDEIEESDKETFYSVMPPFEEFDYYFKQLRYQLLFGNRDVFINSNQLVSIYGKTSITPSFLREVENRFFFYHFVFCQIGKTKDILESYHNNRIKIQLL